jgi:hypothetical protein
MNRKNKGKLKYNVRLDIERADGTLETHWSHNLIPTVGENLIAGGLRTGTLIPISHMALGTGVTAAAAGDTTLETEIARIALDSTGGTTNDVIYIATFLPGVGTGAITEAGLFNDPTTGTLLARDVFSVKNKDAGDQFVFTWTVLIDDDGV